MLGESFLRRPRLSRIFYRGRFFHYPLKPIDSVFGLGPIESVCVLMSYLRWTLFPYRHEDTFEQWVTNRAANDFDEQRPVQRTRRSVPAIDLVLAAFFGSLANRYDDAVPESVTNLFE